MAAAVAQQQESRQQAEAGLRMQGRAVAAAVGSRMRRSSDEKLGSVSGGGCSVCKRFHSAGFSKVAVSILTKCIKFAIRLRSQNFDVAQNLERRLHFLSHTQTIA